MLSSARKLVFHVGIFCSIASIAWSNSSLGEKFSVQIQHNRLNSVVVISISNEGSFSFQCNGLHLRSVFSETDPDLDERVEIVFFDEIALDAGERIEHKWFYDDDLVLDFSDLLGLDSCS